MTKKKAMNDKEPGAASRASSLSKIPTMFLQNLRGTLKNYGKSLMGQPVEDPNDPTLPTASKKQSSDDQSKSKEARKRRRRQRDKSSSDSKDSKKSMASNGNKGGAKRRRRRRRPARTNDKKSNRSENDNEKIHTEALDSSTQPK